jgi:hypothetical protein
MLVFMLRLRNGCPEKWESDATLAGNAGRPNPQFVRRMRDGWCAPALQATWVSVCFSEKLYQFEWLRGLQRVVSLDISLCARLEDHHLMHLAHLPCLDALNISKTAISDDGFRFLAGLSVTGILVTLVALQQRSLPPFAVEKCHFCAAACGLNGCAVSKPRNQHPPANHMRSCCCRAPQNSLPGQSKVVNLKWSI